MKVIASLVAPIAIILVTGGCGTPPPVTGAPRHEASVEASRQAREFYAKGDYVAALRQARKAFDAAAAIEDEDGMAVSLINLSMIYQRIGKLEEARESVDRILNDGALQFPRAWVGDAAVRRAVLAADDGDFALAEGLLVRAERSCPADCAIRGKIANVRAQLAIEKGELGSAVESAELGLKESRARADAEEEANALRLSANALLLEGKTAEAGISLVQALSIDKRIGASRKIYRDLLLMGISARQSGDGETAKSHFIRAADVARADGYAEGIAEAESMMVGKLGMRHE